MHETYDSQLLSSRAALPRPVLAPRLGIIGAGQLARMTAMPALQLGCDVVVLEKNAFSPAATLANQSLVGAGTPPRRCLTWPAVPGMVAKPTPLPVIGVPVESKSLKGLDSLLSIVQMPGGVPVATMAIGGGRNAGLPAVRILGASDEALRKQMVHFQARLATESRANNRKLQTESGIAGLR